MSIFCNECGQNIEPGSDLCSGCGAEVPQTGKDAAESCASGNGLAGVGSAKSVDAEMTMQLARCCPKCGYSLVDGDAEICERCGARIVAIPVDRWLRNVLWHSLERDIVEAIQNKAGFLRQAGEAGLSETEAEAAFEREVQKRADVTADVVLVWFEEDVKQAIFEESNVKDVTQTLLSLAKDRKINRRLAQSVLRKKLPRLGAEADELHFDASLDKTSGQIRVRNDGGGTLDVWVTVSAPWIEVHPIKIALTEQEERSIFISLKSVDDPKTGTRSGEIILSSNVGEKRIPLFHTVGKTWFKKHGAKVSVIATLLTLLCTVALFSKEPITRWFNKPTLSAVRAYPGSNAREGETVTLKAEGLNTGPGSTYDWEVKPPTVGQVQGKGPEGTLTISAIDPGFSSTLVEVKLTVTNTYGDTVSETTTISVARPLPAPQVPVEPMDHPVAVRVGERARLTARVGDFNGDQRKLTYDWACSAGHIEGKGPTVELNTSGLDRSVTAIEVTLKVSSPQGLPGHDKSLINILRQPSANPHHRVQPSDRQFVWPRPADKPNGI